MALVVGITVTTLLVGIDDDLGADEECLGILVVDGMAVVDGTVVGGAVLAAVLAAVLGGMVLGGIVLGAVVGGTVLAAVLGGTVLGGIVVGGMHDSQYVFGDPSSFLASTQTVSPDWTKQGPVQLPTSVYGVAWIFSVIRRLSIPQGSV